MLSKCYIVAEIGCNHNGNKELARRMIRVAKECGVDAVKFQTFNANALISKIAPKAEYQKRTTGEKESQLEMTKKLELSHENYLELKNYASDLGVDVFSTPFDTESIDFLLKNNQTIWKIPSGELTNYPYLKKIGSLKCENKKIFLSTGMANIEEIKQCVNILTSFGTKDEDIILLQCNTEYPTPDCDVNLLAINDLCVNFPNKIIGFSDHSVGYLAAVGAVALGAKIIEKHFTLDKNMPGPDHRASATPEELKLLCDNVRRIEEMLGSSKKIVTPSEAKNKNVARKSIVALKEIKMGEIFSENNITCKRPGNGISPMHWMEVLGKTAERDFAEDELVVVRGLKWSGNE